MRKYNGLVSLSSVDDRIRDELFQVDNSNENKKDII